MQWVQGRKGRRMNRIEASAVDPETGTAFTVGASELAHVEAFAAAAQAPAARLGQDDGRRV